MATSHLFRPMGESSKMVLIFQGELRAFVLLVALEYPSVGEVVHVYRNP